MSYDAWKAGDNGDNYEPTRCEYSDCTREADCTDHFGYPVCEEHAANWEEGPDDYIDWPERPHTL